MRIYKYMYACTYIHTYIFMYIYIYVHIYIYTHICVYVFLYVNVFVNANIHTRTHTCIHKYKAIIAGKQMYRDIDIECGRNEESKLQKGCECVHLFVLVNERESSRNNEQVTKSVHAHEWACGASENERRRERQREGEFAPCNSKAIKNTCVFVTQTRNAHNHPTVPHSNWIGFGHIFFGQ